MVTNLDVIVKKYPELVAKCLDDIAIDKNTGELTLCEDTDCKNCIFCSIYDNVSCTSEKIQNWLLQKVEEKESELIDSSNNTKNSNGEITW